MQFDPSSPQAPRRRFGPIPVRLLVPNVITLLAICAGLTANRLSTEGRMELAVAAIVFAAGFFAAWLARPDLRAWIEERFQAWPLADDKGRREGLITGYHEPLLQGSLQRRSESQTPLYGLPATLDPLEGWIVGALAA